MQLTATRILRDHLERSYDRNEARYLDLRRTEEHGSELLASLEDRLDSIEEELDGLNRALWRNDRIRSKSVDLVQSLERDLLDLN